MTAFSTRCWRSGCPESGAPAWVVRWLRVVAWALLMGLLPFAARADTPVDISGVRLERSEEGLFLSARVHFDLPDIVQDALSKGIPIHFTAEAELLRDRWYWTDKKVASATRYMRLAYQPLTRRWRVNVGTSPLNNSGLGLSLGQNFDSLDEAVSALQRLVRWRIGDAADYEPDARHNLQFSFRLDTSQLPRPIQIGVAGQADWTIAVTRNLRLLVETVR